MNKAFMYGLISFLAVAAITAVFIALRAHAHTDGLCEKKITVERTDESRGWGHPLQFICTGTQVNVGESSEDNYANNTKTLNVRLPKNVVCPTVVNKNNWLGKAEFVDEFTVETSDCLS